MKRYVLCLVIATAGCDALPIPILPPDGKIPVIGGISNTQPFLGTYKPAGLNLSGAPGGTFLLASCGCGDWRVLFKPDDGSAQEQFAVHFFSDGAYLPDTPVTVFGKNETTSRTIGGTVNQASGAFTGRAENLLRFQSISATRGNAHNLAVEACGLCHIGEDSIYPLPPTHPDKYKTNPLVCFDCHTVNGQ